MLRSFFVLLTFVHMGMWLLIWKYPITEIKPDTKQNYFASQMMPDAIKLLPIDSNITNIATNNSNTNLNNANPLLPDNPLAGLQTCLEANLANESEIAFIDAAIKNKQFNISTTIKNDVMSGQYLVYVDGQSPKQAENTLFNLRKKGLYPITMINYQQKPLLALGAFSEELQARQFINRFALSNAQILNDSEVSVNIFWLKADQISIQSANQLKQILQKLKVYTRYCS